VKPKAGPPPSPRYSDSTSGYPANWQLALSTIGITAVGLIQPVLDLVGRYPDFFIARAATSEVVILLGVLLGLVVPLIFGLTVAATFHLHPTAGKALHVLVLACMSGLLVLSVARQTAIGAGPWAIVIGMGGMAGLLIAWGYYHFDWMVWFGSILGAAPLVITLHFLFISPSSEVVWGTGDEGVPTFAHVGAPAPVIMVIFDEFPLASIIDSKGEIRGKDFPAFAGLSDDATWFRNAVGTQQGTRDALPTMLTGVAQSAGEKLPHYADHPSTLFTLLSMDYSVNAMETLTQLCPKSICTGGSRGPISFEERWLSMFQDLAIVSGHMFAPTTLGQTLPPIDQNWGDFAPDEVVRPENWSIRDRLQQQVRSDRRNLVDTFLNMLHDPLRPDEFYFIHLPLPHSPWSYLADGRTYPSNPGIPGKGEAGWSSNPFLVEQAYQRHLIQVQYADHIVSSVVRNLQRSGSYDSTLLVVAADHGIAIRPNREERLVEPDTVGDLAAVPLFIKAPKQSEGFIDDYRAETTDIVPTVASLLQTKIPWEVDGVDLSANNRPERLSSTMDAPDGSVIFGVDGNEKLFVADYHSTFFGDRGPFGLSPPGFENLLGTLIPDDAIISGRVSYTLDFPELYTDVDPESDDLPVLLSGTLEGQVSPGDVLAVTRDSEILAMTQSWTRDRGEHRFQALLPPDELGPGDNEFEVFVVHRDGDGFSFAQISRSAT
jgi:hypothetical protein